MITGVLFAVFINLVKLIIILSKDSKSKGR